MFDPHRPRPPNTLPVPATSRPARRGLAECRWRMDGWCARRQTGTCWHWTPRMAACCGPGASPTRRRANLHDGAPHLRQPGNHWPGGHSIRRVPCAMS